MNCSGSCEQNLAVQFYSVTLCPLARASLLSWLDTLSLQDTIKLEMMQGMRSKRVTSLVTMVDKDKDGFISKQEFLDLVRRKEEHFEKIEKSRLLQYLR